MADISLNYREKKPLLRNEAKKGHRVEQGKKQPRIPTADEGMMMSPLSTLWQPRRQVVSPWILIVKDTPPFPLRQVNDLAKLQHIY
jgi:hypothetical protein